MNDQLPSEESEPKSGSLGDQTSPKVITPVASGSLPNTLADPLPSDQLATPKTDAAAVWASDFGVVVPADFARAQERRIAELESTNNADVAAVIAHRACCGSEHDPANGKLHGYCVVCGVPWPCETAQYFLRKPM